VTGLFAAASPTDHYSISSGFCFGVWIVRLILLCCLICALAGCSSTSHDNITTQVDSYGKLIEDLGGKSKVMLDFSDSAITDADLAALPLPESVRGIDLSRTKVTDEGIASLTRAQNLEELVLIEVRITDASVEHLLAMPNLWNVRFDRVEISRQKMLELNKVLTERNRQRTMPETTQP
jgi:hypothetical protein